MNDFRSFVIRPRAGIKSVPAQERIERNEWISFISFLRERNERNEWSPFLRIRSVPGTNRIEGMEFVPSPARGQYERITKFVPFVPGFRNEMNEFRSWFPIRSWIWTNPGNEIRYSFLEFRNEWNEIRSCRNEFVNEFVPFVNGINFVNEFRHRGG